MLCSGLLLTPCMAQKGKIVYPKTAKVNVVDDYFGTKVADPYRWLENDTSKETAAWVKAERSVTDAFLSKIPFRKELLNRLTQLVNYERYGVPYEHKGKYYFSKNDGLQNQSVFYVQDNLDQEPRVLLDPNKLSTDGTVALAGSSLSPDGRYLAYQVSRSGSDWQEIYVMDTSTGKTLDDHILWAKFSDVSWYKDGFYYSAYDAPVKGKEYSNVNLNHKVYYHRLGSLQKDDVLFYQNKERPQSFYYVETNNDQTMLFLNEGGENDGNLLSVKNLSKPDSKLIPMTHDNRYTYDFIDNVGDTIFIRTNYGAPKWRIMAVDLNNPDISAWRTVVPEGDDVITSALLADGKMVLTRMKDASDHVYVYTTEGKYLHEIKLPSVGSVSFNGNRDEKDCFFSFSSFTEPSTIYRYDINKNTYQVFKAPKLTFNPDDYTTEQVFYPSKDGTKVPMFITYKKGVKRDGTNPLLLYGYGGFDISLQPSFASMMMPFIEKGGIYVETCLRGGGEYGEAWHQAGTKMHKQNVFDDFIAAGEYLIQQKYTNKDKLAIMGGSNGGLLVGACLTQRPDLFRVVIAEVGVMDMLRYHKFTIGWNWASDYGTSADSREMFEYLKGYSPLHNIRPGVKYPATLITTGDHDDRVVPAHSFKFAATLQNCNASNNPILIRIDSKAGHGGGKPMSKRLEEYADIFSFIMANMDMK